MYKRQLLAYLMMQLSCYNYIVYEWQSVIANNKLILKKIKGEPLTRTDPVSYTHLDVYKRQDKRVCYAAYADDALMV